MVYDYICQRESVWKTKPSRNRGHYVNNDKNSTKHFINTEILWQWLVMALP